MNHSSPASRWRRLSALLLVAALVLGACGGGDDDTETSERSDGEKTAEPVAANPKGEVRLTGSLLTSSSLTQWDPVKLASPAGPSHYLVYDTLLRAKPDGSYEPKLATAADVADPQTIKVTLREGVTFSDGAPLDAEAAKASILRNRDSKNAGAFAVEMQEIEDVTVDSPTVFTIHLKKPIAGTFYALLSRGETFIVSPKAVADGVDLNAKPVGAGPFTLESLVPESKMRLVKNPSYWDAKNIKLAAVEYVHTGSPEAVANALKAGQADIADQITPDVVKALEGSDVKVHQEVTDSTLFWAQICKSRPPLDDVKVRQALNYGLDRDQLNQILYDGKSEPQWGFWSSKSKFHDKSLDGYYKRDVAKAKKLLAEAGYPDGFKLQLATSSTFGIGITGTELVQAQWKEIGVDVEIVQLSNLVQEFFVENKYPGMFFPLQRGGLDKVTRNLVPGSIGDVCNWNDPDLNKLVEQLRAVKADSDEAVQLWHKLDKLALERAMNIFGVFGTAANAWNDGKLANVQFVNNFQDQPYVDLTKVYVKA
jgi:peptide/nickel transport system substrate-binding protein